MAKVYVEFEEPESCSKCPLFYATEGAFSDACQLLNESDERVNTLKEKFSDCPLKKVEEIEDLKEVNEAAKQELIEARYRNSELKKENDDLKSQIKSFENDFDYQNKVINKYKEDLKKLRVAYIQAQVANVISGTDFESILKNILNGELKK